MTNMSEFEFIQLKKGRGRAEKVKNQIRLALYKNTNAANNHMLVIFIGRDVATRAGLSKGDKIQIGINKNDFRKVILKKSDFGLTVSMVSSRSSNFSFRVTVSDWEKFQIKKEDFPAGEVKYTIDEGNNILLEI